MSSRQIETKKIAWHVVAREYCRRALTDPKDKLPAFSSIAAYKSDDRYLEGLWKSSLGRDLLSVCVVFPGHPRESRRSPVWRAPSWSFMSIDAPITFAKRRGSQEMTHRDYENYSELQSVDIRLVSAESPYGQISFASLSIKCVFLGSMSFM